MKQINVDGIQFKDFDVAIKYLQEMKKREEELIEAKRVEEERSNRLKVIQNYYDALSNLTSKFKKDYNERIIILGGKVIPSADELYKDVAKELDDKGKIYYSVYIKDKK